MSARSPWPCGSPAALGERLREARLARGESLADAAAVLRIRPAFLEALESGDHSCLPGDAYASGFLRCYAGHLGLRAGTWAVSGAEHMSAVRLAFRSAPVLPPSRPRFGSAGALLALGTVYIAWHLSTAGIVGGPGGAQDLSERLAAVSSSLLASGAVGRVADPELSGLALAAPEPAEG
jgi:cytoskeleton protein RodZ